MSKQFSQENIRSKSFRHNHNVFFKILCNISGSFYLLKGVCSIRGEGLIYPIFKTERLNIFNGLQVNVLTQAYR